MHPASIASLTAALTLVAGSVTAQVTKPRTSSGDLDRLPAPAPMIAAQQDDGRIRVTWGGVVGAAKYSLTRSVPNVGSGLLTLPNPSDTTFVDSDVKPGYTYYYLVQALTESGGAGMKATTEPVLAQLKKPPTTVAAPTKPSASPYPYLKAHVSWESSQTGLLFLVERATVSGGTPTGWEPTWSYERCCEAWDRLDRFPAGTRLIYRITAYDSAAPANRSAPVLTNEITTYRIDASTVIGGAHLLHSPAFFGGAQILGQLGLTKRHWRSFDESVVAVDSAGLVTGRSIGVAFVMVTGMTAAGAVQSVVWRVEVPE